MLPVKSLFRYKSCHFLEELITNFVLGRSVIKLMILLFGKIQIVSTQNYLHCKMNCILLFFSMIDKL